MVRGIFSSAAGMISEYKRIDMLGNNAANVNTPGYKDSDVTFSTFGDELVKRMNDNSQVGNIPQYVSVGQETTNLSAGALQQTGLSTDLAIDGNGFFAVQSPAGGGVKYTQSGDFSVDGQGYLALPTGERLLGSDGNPLYVGSDKFSVQSDGTVTTAAGAAGKINLYDTNGAQGIVKRTDGFFDIPGAVQANGAIKQGWIEGSNTDMVGNMTSLMEATRSFQGCQQAFQVSDDTLDKAVTELGSLK